jgi:hypothetical protein
MLAGGTQRCRGSCRWDAWVVSLARQTSEEMPILSRFLFVSAPSRRERQRSLDCAGVLETV